MASSLAQPTV